MGCASSKILTRSGSFQKEVKQSKQRKTNGLEELLISKDGGDQFLALLCTANTVARRIKASSSLREEPERNVEATTEPTNSKTMEVEEPENPENELMNIETINAWELLAGLEVDKEEEEEEQQQREHHHNVESSNIDKDEDYKFMVGNDSMPSTSFNLMEDTSNGSATQTTSIHIVEDCDAMEAGNYSLEERKYMTETSRSTDVFLLREHSTISVKMKDHGVEQEEKHEELEMKSIGTEAGVQENVGVQLDQMSEKGPKRKAMAKELRALKVPAFEFSRSGSLREWLKLGGQVFSPGSYVTPKFGNFVSRDCRNGETGNVFDPDLIAQFEQAMKQLAMEEEFVLQQITESLEKKGHEGDIPRVEISEEHIQV